MNDARLLPVEWTGFFCAFLACEPHDWDGMGLAFGSPTLEFG